MGARGSPLSTGSRAGAHLPWGGCAHRRSDVGHPRHVAATRVDAAPFPGPGTEARRAEAAGGGEQDDQESHGRGAVLAEHTRILRNDHVCETRKLSHLCSNLLTCHYLGASAVGEYRLYPLPLSLGFGIHVSCPAMKRPSE